MFRSLIIIGIISLVVISCYYDSEEYLYPSAGICDTTNVTFSSSIQPIITNYCVGCHSGGAPNGDVNLSDFNNIHDAAINKNLLNAIFGTGGVIQMPPGGALSECDMNKFRIWIKAGALKN